MSAINRLDLASAITEQEVLSWWQDWCRLLKARLELLDLRVRDDEPGFDLDESDTSSRRLDLEAMLRAIPEQRRAAFDVEVEQHRQEVHRRVTRERRQAAPAGERLAPIESRDVERVALAELLDRCQGDPALPRMGAVPVNGRWWDVDPTALDTVPDDAVYAIGGHAGRPAPARWVLVGIAIALIWIVGGLLYVSGQGGPTARRPAADAATINGRPLAVWAPQRVQLQNAAGDLIALELAPILPMAWPQAPATQAGGWRQGQVWPLEICLPHQAITANLDEITLQSADAAPTRIYALSTEPPADAPADLRIVACGDGVTRRYGVLAATAPIPMATAGESYTIPGAGEIAVAQVTVVGRGQEPGVPSTRALVYVDVRAPAGVDWPALSPRLALQDGTVVGPSDMVRDLGDGVARITHMIDLPVAPLAAAWDLTDPASRQVLRWRLTLQPPRSRQEELGAAVMIERVDAAWTAGGRVAVSLELRGVGSAPITVTGEDLVLRQEGLALQAPVIEPAAIGPGARATIRFELVIDPDRPLQLELGGDAYALTFSEGG